MQFDGDIDRLADKITSLNARVRKDLRKAGIRHSLDQMVLDGKLGYDPETDEYWRLPTQGAGGTVEQG